MTNTEPRSAEAAPGTPSLLRAAAGIVIGYVISTALGGVLIGTLMPVHSSPSVLNLGLAAVYVVGGLVAAASSVAGGYVAGRIARRRHMLVSALSSLVGLFPALLFL